MDWEVGEGGERPRERERECDGRGVVLVAAPREPKAVRNHMSI